MPFYSKFIFSLDNRAYQQLAELLLLVEKRSRSERVGEGRVAQAFYVQITRPRLLRECIHVLSRYLSANLLVPAFDAND